MEAHRKARRVGGWLLGVAVGAGGCVTADRHGAGGPTQADRLVQVYPELKSGRFAVIADFEDARHMELFQLIGVSPNAKCVLDRKGGRPQTGRQCMSFTAGSADDTVVVGNVAEGQWYLKRDWRAYDLLLLSVESPTPGLALDLSIAAGPPESRMSAESSIALNKGWNVLRIDLAEVGEMIPLDDVQQMRMSVNGITKAAKLQVDDIVLAGNREDLFGDARNTTGKLYVQRVGRRWNVGAGGRFELSFANGQVTHWYNLAVDPNRLRNLVQGTTLGPAPVVVDANGVEAGDFSALGRSVVARQRLIETSVVRAVVACEWRFVNDPDAAGTDRPFQRWLYTIYPTGQVFVYVEATARAADWLPPGLGLALTLAGGSENDWAAQIGAEGASASGEESKLPAGSVLARNASADAAILWVLAEGSGESRIVSQQDASARRSMFVAVSGDVAEPVQRWSSQVFLCTSNGLAESEAAARARQYISPSDIRMELGAAAPDAAGLRPPHPFDASDGCLAIEPDQGRVRLTLPGDVKPIFSPAFRIGHTAGELCWVYVDHLVRNDTGRDVDGSLVFQLPQTITKRTLVEVLSRHPETSPSP